MASPRGAAAGCLLALALCVSLVSARGAAAQGSQPTYDVSTRLDVRVPMTDGSELATNLFLPACRTRACDGGPWPVVLERTPYGRGTAEHPLGRFLAERGYVYVVQDVRGNDDSDGDFEPIRRERDDGYDTQAWIAQQPWCDGRIATTGGSYMGITQWQPAVRAHPAVQSMCTLVTGANAYDLAFTDGALNLELAALWAYQETEPPGFDPSTRDNLAALRTLPLARLDIAGAGRAIPFWQEWLRHPTRDDFWRSMAADRYEQIDVPVFHIGGWYDVFAVDVVTDYAGMVSRAPSPETRQAQRLLMGPWRHGNWSNADGRIGQVDFGPHSWPDLPQLMLDWYDRTLKGLDTGQAAPVRLFVMGENVWRDEQEWPLARTRTTDYWLISGAGANTRHGDGALVLSQPDAAATDTFTYDPADPVPTVGGQLLNIEAGAFDQRDVEERPDVLVYTTPVLTDAVEVTGPIRLILYAASDAPSTDFTAKLVDVHPTGFAQNLTAGVLRTTYRQSDTAPTPTEPGRITRYEIDVGVTSNLFHAGHRIRLEVSSSNFPRWDRNPNTGQPFGQSADLAVARQTVHLGGERASRLVLPIIPR